MRERVSGTRPQPDKGDDAALEAARALGHAIGESPAYRQFEAAYERFRADQSAQERLARFDSRQQEIREAAMWGGASAQQEQQLEREWDALCATPVMGDYLRAQAEFTAALRESARMISDAIGVDYGGVCSPSGGCC